MSAKPLCRRLMTRALRSRSTADAGRSRPTVELLEDRSVPATAFGLTGGNVLLRFDTAAPGTLVSSAAITNLQGGTGEAVVGIDFRPSGGQLYALSNTAGVGRLYTVDPATAAATLVATLAADPTDLTSPYAGLTGTSFGVDFNPVADRLRVVSNGATGNNLRIVPAGASAGAVTTDGDLNPGAPSVVGAAYTNNFAGTATTTLFDIDSATDSLFTQNPPNNGTLAAVGPLNAGGDVQTAVGFDIQTAAGGNAAFAALTTNGTSSALYTIDLATGAATLVGPIGPAATLLTGLAVAPAGFTNTTLAGTTATFTGSVDADTLVLDQSGGFLRHNRFTAGDPGFNSNIDFDPATLGDQTLNAADPAVTVVVNGGGGNDAVTIGSAAAPASGLAATFQVNGQAGGGDTLTVDATADATARAVTLNGSTSTITGLGGPITYGTLEGVTVNAGAAGDTVNVQGTQAAATAVNAGGGNDTVVFAAGASLNGGAVDGGAGTDALDYTAATAAVAVNLGLSTTGLSASLDGTQENPPVVTAAAGTATLSNYNAVTKTFDVAVTVTNLDPALITGYHIHRAPVGVNGPIIIPLDTLFGLGALVPAGTGFTFNATGVSLAASLLGGVANEAAFLGGLTYLNFHTATNPGGVIRGQILSTANTNLSAGTTTGTGGVSNVENVTGGAGADSLVGNNLASTLTGLGGNDTMLGGPGADTFLGGDGDDVMVWSNGDGSDVMNGQAGADTVVVNGAVGAGDAFRVQAGAGGRVDFARTNLGTFTLDVGTTETMRLVGAGGDDAMTVNSLAGVTDLAALNLFGLAGDDTFAVTPAPAGTAVTAAGGVGTDAVVVDTAGTTTPSVTITADNAAGRTGTYTFGDRANVAFAQVETLQTPTNFLTVTKTDGRATAAAGTRVSYTVTVTNPSGLGVSGVRVTDAVPAALTGVTWTAAFTAGSTGTAAGTGPVNEVVNLAAGGSVTYTVTGTIRPTATGQLTNTAAAAVPAGLTDSTAADGTATDTTALTPAGPGRRLAVSGLTNGSAVLFAPGADTGRYATAPAATLAPFGNTGGNVRAATGDVNGDGTPDTVLVTGPGTPIRVAVISGVDNTTVLAAPFDPFGDDFTGGGFVAAGDVDGDGRSEFVVTPDRGGGPRVVIFSLVTGAARVRANFFGIDDPAFRGGARAALGDVNRDGTPDLAVAAGFLGGPRVALFNGATLFGAPARLINDFFAFPGADAVRLRNGAYVAIGDVTADGFADLVFGSGPGGSPRVYLLDGARVSSGDVTGAQANPLANFFVAGNDADRGGVRVATKDADGDGRADVVAGSGEGVRSGVRVYPGQTFGGPGEPSGFQDLDPFGGQVLPGGVFVG